MSPIDPARDGLIALACLLASGCSKPATTSAATTATSHAALDAPCCFTQAAPPAGSGPHGALATGAFGGPDADQSQTAAVSPMSRPNGTQPPVSGGGVAGADAPSIAGPRRTR